ncbi:unnamed protein product, partial [marine sediment metagenome]
MNWFIPSIILILQYLQATGIRKDMKEKLQEIIDKLAELVPEIPAPLAPIIITPQRSNRYHVFEFVTNPAIAWVNHPMGIKDYLEKHDVKFGVYMTVLAIGGGFTYRVNSAAESLCAAFVGEEWEDFEIAE